MLTHHYPNINAPKDQIIISNDTYGFETPGSNWIALNPTLGYELGWKLESEYWFHWVNASGNTVVWSLCWGDGCIELHNRFARTEVGDGWLVLASKSGFEEIMNHFPELNRGCVVNRRIGWLGSEGSNVAKRIGPVE